MSHCESLCTEFETTCTCFITSSALKIEKVTMKMVLKKGELCTETAFPP